MYQINNPHSQTFLIPGIPGLARLAGYVGMKDRGEQNEIGELTKTAYCTYYSSFCLIFYLQRGTKHTGLWIILRLLTSFLLIIQDIEIFIVIRRSRVRTSRRRSTACLRASYSTTGATSSSPPSYARWETRQVQLRDWLEFDIAGWKQFVYCVVGSVLWQCWCNLISLQNAKHEEVSNRAEFLAVMQVSCTICPIMLIKRYNDNESTRLVLWNYQH